MVKDCGDTSVHFVSNKFLLCGKIYEWYLIVHFETPIKPFPNAKKCSGCNISVSLNNSDVNQKAAASPSLSLINCFFGKILF